LSRAESAPPPAGTVRLHDAGAERHEVRVRWATEVRATIKLSVPIALTQLGQIAMFTCDLLLIGRLGESAVAAASLAHTVFFACFVLGMGVMLAAAPLAAQAFGAGDQPMIGRATRTGLWAAIAIGLPFTLLQAWGEPILLLLEQPPDAAAMAGQYLLPLSWCTIPAFFFIVLRGFMGAVNRPEPALWITLIAIPLNAALAYALIYGALGLPRLELYGAGLATTLVNLGMCAAALRIALKAPAFRGHRVFAQVAVFDWPVLRRLLALGVPISAALMLEFGVFAAAVVLMGWFGTTALAAHQVAIQIASITFMVPFGIAQAATVRVGQALGRHDPAGIRAAGLVAMQLGALFMALMAMLLFLGRHEVPLLFFGGESDRAVVSLTATLLLFAALFQIADGVQTITNGALRGLNDTRVPMLMALTGFWLIGFAASYGLAFPVGLGPEGVWVGLLIGLCCYALMLLLRFRALSVALFKPGRVPVKSGDGEKTR
jgi:MATE family multidrug resistance protein